MSAFKWRLDPLFWKLKIKFPWSQSSNVNEWDSNQTCVQFREWLCSKGKQQKVMAKPAIANNLFNMGTWMSIIFKKKQIKRGISLTKNIWSNSCFILHSLYCVSAANPTSICYAIENQSGKSVRRLPSKQTARKIFALAPLQLQLIRVF